MAHIKDTSQYQLYLEVAEALRLAGYEVAPEKDKKNEVTAFIRRNGDFYGYIYATGYPPSGSGFFASISPYETYLKTIQMQRNNLQRNFGLSAIEADEYMCSHESSYVGAFAADPRSSYDTKKWLQIVEEIVNGC